MSQNHRERINNLQVVRAAAALLVVYFHTHYSLAGLKPFGSFGVDLFFVLSGFIMGSISAGHPHAFFRRRLVRILPAYWIFTALVFGIAAVSPSLVNSTEASPSHLIKSLLFIPYRKSNGFIQPILYVGWTLNYEMFFYAVVSLSLATTRRYAMLLASVLILACMAVCFPFRDRNAIAEFYWNPQLLEFISGIVCFSIYARSNENSRACRAVFIGLILVSSALLIGTQAGGIRIAARFGGHLPWTCLLASSVILSSAMLAKGGLDARRGLLVLIGDASYVLYLVHPYIEAGLAKFSGRWLPSLAPSASLAGLLVTLVTSTSVAIAIHLWVELPVVAALSRRFIPGRATREDTSPLKDGTLRGPGRAPNSAGISVALRGTPAG